ncbi:TetR/AcrR family transcriptional regulator, partial [Streptomyces sp. TRM76130]|nr:TetR/AcrR family transcriptional regulator [Streptomyces sp. TRM76130]
RHAETLAAAIAADPNLSRSATASRTIARLVIDAYALARDAADPEAALDEVFRMIEAAWEVTRPSGRE